MTTLYLGGERHLLVARLSSSGLEVIERHVVGEVPSFLACAPRRRRIYAAVEESSRVASLEVRDDGSLELLGDVPCPGGPAFVSVDPSERWVLSASYGSGEVRSYPILDDGSLGPARAELVAGKWAHAALVEPVSGNLFVPCKGADTLRTFAFDAESGALTPELEIETDAGVGPRHVAFSKDGRRVYLVGENDASLSVYRRGEEGLFLAQKESLLPRPFRDGDSGADVHLSPDERFVYASARGHDSVAIFEVTQTGVRLRGIESTRGRIPRNFGVIGGDRLIVANQESAALAVFTRDAQSGYLEFSGSHELGEKIFWVGEFPLSSPR